MSGMDIQGAEAQALREKINRGEKLSPEQYKSFADAYIAQKGWHTDGGWIYARFRAQAEKIYGADAKIDSEKDFKWGLDGLLASPETPPGAVSGAITEYLRGYQDAIRTQQIRIARAKGEGRTLN